jgi:tetratricopeptide (TPR) repeat protein/tRNA A-37 threonylcarbamoyl transferase component Bud32
MPDEYPIRRFITPRSGPSATTETSLPILDDLTSDPNRTGPHVPGSDITTCHDLPIVPGYVIEWELGRGGMGVVYRARHLTLKRPTALKMVLGTARADSKEIIRFLAEAEALATVRHPHVIGVYEFGEADGRPFLALEFCPGGTLAETLKAGRLDATAAAVLVRKLAEGVAAAHAMGIVHRDLKPGNVLFNESGEPKVTDFGLAKLGGGTDVTQSQAVMGTPAYMAPEQAKGESKFVGPQADVWALGVILYECLTGRRPFVANDTWAVLQQVMNEEPAGVRAIRRTVPRDLDLICRKCLAKLPHERYATAKELADDLGRFLEGKTISIHPAGPIERTWKWTKRNRPAVAVMAALLVGIVGLSVGVVWAIAEAKNARTAERNERQARGEAEMERNEAVRQQLAATAAKEFLTQVLVQSDAWGQASLERTANPEVKLVEALDYASKSIEGAFADQPLIEADLRDTIGNAYRNLAKHADAERHLRAALELRERVLGPDHPDTLSSVNNLAGLHMDKGDYSAAEPLYQRALAGYEKSLGPDHPHTLTSVNNLAKLLSDKGDTAVAEQLLQRALSGSEKSLGPDHPETLTSVDNLADLYHDTKNYTEAESLYQRALVGREKLLGPDHPDTLASLNNLATLYQDKGDIAAAEPLLKHVLARCEKIFGPDHPETLTSVNNLAALYYFAGRHVEAEPLMKRAVASREKLLGPDHPDTLTSVNNLAMLYVAMKDAGAAEPLLKRVLAGRQKLFGCDHPDTLQSVGNLSGHFLTNQQYADAIPLLDQAVRIFSRRPEMAQAVPLIRSDLGFALLASGQPAEAEPHLLAGYEGLSQQKTLNPANRRRQRMAAQGLVELYEQIGPTEKASEWRAKLKALPPEIAPRPRELE